MTRTGYCEPDDLLLGSIPLPGYIDAAQAVGAAADEMDSYLGLFYQIPIPAAGDASQTALDPADRIPPVVYLTLKRINANLASGRIILQVAAGGEQDRLHAYGVSLVQDAVNALCQLKEGKPVLQNVPVLNVEEGVRNGPLISNLDSESQVEAFYDRIANPNYFFPPTTYDRDYRLTEGWYTG